MQRSQAAWLGVVSLLYYASMTVADDLAQSIFVSRLGVAALPNIFLFQAAIDLFSAFLYLPLTRRRSPRAVWRVLLVSYAAMLALSWFALVDGRHASGAAYLLYLAHESISSLAVIHWGVLLLSLVVPSQSKALFPMLFAVGRLGALVGGLFVGALAVALGAHQLLWIAISLALLSATASMALHGGKEAPAALSPDEAKATWTRAWASPLVKMIALSTATMVVLRYGLRMVSLEEIRASFDNDKDKVAAFLGLFSVIGNGAALVLGLWVVPRLLTRVGIGAANLIYASSNVLAFLMTSLFPSLASASAARFVETPLKHALKTPLSVLFYGAENRQVQLAARALVFGAAIPLATAVTGLAFRELHTHLLVISVGGVLVSVLFVVMNLLQNRRYRERLLDTMEEQLGEGIDARLCTGMSTLAPSWPARSRDLLAGAMASSDDHVRSLAHLYLGEALPHRQAEALRCQVETLVQTLAKPIT